MIYIATAGFIGGGTLTGLPGEPILDGVAFTGIPNTWGSFPVGLLALIPEIYRRKLTVTIPS